MWKVACVVLVLVAFCASSEAGRGRKATWKLPLCEFGDRSAACDGPYECVSRPIGRRTDGQNAGDTPPPEIKVCVQKSCENDEECALEGVEVRCLGRPNHKRCGYPKPVHVFYSACRVESSNGSLVRERECLAPNSECSTSRPFTYLNTEYTLSRCMPAEDGENAPDGGRRPGRGRGGRRRGGRRGGDRQDLAGNTEGEDEGPEDDEEEEQPAGSKNGRRGGRGRGRGRNKNRRQNTEGQ